MAKGRVKWFNNQKGYGFIVAEDHPEDKGEDIFVHYSVIQEDGFKTLKEGQEVEFEAERGPKGELAQKVVKI